MPEHEMYPVPLVGSAVDLTKPAEVLQAYEDVRQAERLLGEARHQLTRVLVEHSMQVGRRTVTVPGGQQYERTGGPEVTYIRPADLETKLRDAGMPEARISEIVVTTIDKRVDGRQANAAARANAEYERIIAEHRMTIDKPYRISPK